MEDLEKISTKLNELHASLFPVYSALEDQLKLIDDKFKETGRQLDLLICRQETVEMKSEERQLETSQCFEQRHSEIEQRIEQHGSETNQRIEQHDSEMKQLMELHGGEMK